MDDLLMGNPLLDRDTDDADLEIDSDGLSEGAPDMNAWSTDAANILNSNHGAFTPSMDPSMAFLQPSSNTVDPSQFQNQRIFNGTPRNASPAFHNPVYQTNSVIPSKRPRPRDDSLGTSPRQAPGGLPVSRSQTPHQTPYPGYHATPNGTQHFPQAPLPYQHLQQSGSANATPSPIMQNQHFNAHGGPQRLQTASPSPFSPAGAHMGSQISPSHSDHGSRVNTPQNNPAGYMQSAPYGQGYNQHFTPPPAMTSAGGQGPLQAQYNAIPQSMQAQVMSQQQQQQRYAMQIQAQARQLAQQNAAATLQGRPTSSGMNPMMNSAGQMMNNPQLAAMRQMQQNMTKSNNPEVFLKNLQKFMFQRGLPLDTNPLVSGRSLNLMQLYALVLKLGGSAKVTKMDQWGVIAQQLQFSTLQYPNAGPEIHHHFARNLAPYEVAWMSMQQQKQEQIQNMQRHGNDMSGMQNQLSPVKQVSHQGQDQHPQQHQNSQDPQNMMRSMIPLQNNVHQTAMNGFMTTPPEKAQSKQPNSLNHQRTTLSRPTEGTPPNGQQTQFPIPSPLSGKRLDSSTGKSLLASSDQSAQMPLKQPIEDPYKPAVFSETSLHGPINVGEMFDLTIDLVELKPTVPTFQELGIIDIHALTMSIKSGIHAEVRMALDTLTTMSVEPRLQLSLDNCDDLVEALVDCAEDQVELLAENAAEVSDVMLISSYEEVVRGCRTEIESLQDVPEFGSPEYDLDRAVDRLICITTLIRNFSFYESNFGLLGMPMVVKFMATIIRYIGTRNMLLRTHQNTLDFMKDIVIYLSNLSHAIQLPGKEEALCLLHFLLSFAPCPPPTSSGTEEIMFTMYNPSVHKYMPAAVDSLAKLLARDEPNRTFYKAIFAADSSSTPAYELLTRTFALAIAPVPEHTRGNLIPMVDARKPFLLQGMLAAEILSNLAPGSDHGLARSWLESTDGFALSLLRLVCLLSTDRTSQAIQRHAQAGRMGETDPNSYGAITHRGMAVLRRLAEKSKNGENGAIKLPLGVLPKKESLLGALLTANIDPNVVRQLCAYSGSEEG